MWLKSLYHEYNTSAKHEMGGYIDLVFSNVILYRGLSLVFVRNLDWKAFKHTYTWMMSSNVESTSFQYPLHIIPVASNKQLGTHHENSFEQLRKEKRPRMNRGQEG